MTAVDVIAEKSAEKREAIQAAKDALALLRGEHREADAWGRYHLANAVNSIFRGAYRLAAAEAELATIAASQRDDAWTPGSDFVPESCTIDVLQDALDVAESEPVRHSAHFGPIILVRP